MIVNEFPNPWDLIRHPTFWATSVAWLSTCLIKVVVHKLQTGETDWRRFFSSGGMPSSHLAFASALTMAIALSEGFNSAVCGLSVGFTIITAVDAVGVRQAAGRQAQALNQILAQSGRKRLKGPVLKESLGHTPWEMLWGIVCGALICYLIYPVR